jgi:hypothetical protein
MKDNIDQNFIRMKDLALVATVIGLLATLWKYSGLNEIKETLSEHSTSIAVIQVQYKDIKQDLDEIKRTNRAIKKNTE